MDENNHKKIFDISLPLNEETISYPGNPEIKIEPQKSSTGQTIISRYLFRFNEQGGIRTGCESDTIYFP